MTHPTGILLATCRRAYTGAGARVWKWSLLRACSAVPPVPLYPNRRRRFMPWVRPTVEAGDPGYIGPYGVGDHTKNRSFM